MQNRGAAADHAVPLAEYGFSPEELLAMGLDPVTVEDGDQDDPDVWRILHEWALFRMGITYEAQGYHTGDGVTLWARKIDEHFVVSTLVDKARDVLIDR